MKRNKHISTALREEFIELYVTLQKFNLRIWDHVSLDDLFETFAARVYTRKIEGSVRVGSKPSTRMKEIIKRESRIMDVLSKKLKQLGYEPPKQLTDRLRRC